MGQSHFPLARPEGLQATFPAYSITVLD